MSPLASQSARLEAKTPSPTPSAPPVTRRTPRAAELVITAAVGPGCVHRAIHRAAPLATHRRATAGRRRRKRRRRRVADQGFPPPLPPPKSRTIFAAAAHGARRQLWPDATRQRHTRRATACSPAAAARGLSRLPFSRRPRRQRRPRPAVLQWRPVRRAAAWRSAAAPRPAVASPAQR